MLLQSNLRLVIREPKAKLLIQSTLGRHLSLKRQEHGLSVEHYPDVIVIIP